MQYRTNRQRLGFNVAMTAWLLVLVPLIVQVQTTAGEAHLWWRFAFETALFAGVLLGSLYHLHVRLVMPRTATLWAAGWTAAWAAATVWHGLSHLSGLTHWLRVLPILAVLLTPCLGAWERQPPLPAGGGAADGTP